MRPRTDSFQWFASDYLCTFYGECFRCIYEQIAVLFFCFVLFANVKKTFDLYSSIKSAKKTKQNAKCNVVCHHHQYWLMCAHKCIEWVYTQVCLLWKDGNRWLIKVFFHQESLSTDTKSVPGKWAMWKRWRKKNKTKTRMETMSTTTTVSIE